MAENVSPPEFRPTPVDLAPTGSNRFMPLLAVFGISVAVVGFVTGIREPRQTERGTVPPAAAGGQVPAAVNYSDLPAAKIGPNAAWVETLAQLKYDKPGIFDAVTRTDAMKSAALADRARNRAYDGAPPTIPHPIEARSAAACLACHGEGLKVGARIASRISHAHLTNCTQCHVEHAPVGFERNPVPVENAFVGIYRAGPGERASPGAPPTMPHHAWMRENCTSCHGLLTRPGTRTTHPWLTNCTQCHAPSAALDQLDFSGAQR